MSHRRDLTKVGDLIDAVLGAYASVGVEPVVRLRRAWDDIAGEWAARCRPIAIRGSVLTLEVASGLDASMVRFALPDLLSAVRAELGENPEISRIALRVRTASHGRE